MTAPSFSSLVVIGRVVKPQGRVGELLVESLSDRADRFPSLRRAFMESAADGVCEIHVTSCWPHKSRWVLKLEGVDSIDAAERLRGCRLAIPEDELAKLPSGTYYYHELTGLAVVTESGETVGRVTDIMDAGAAPILAIKTEKEEILIPFAETFVREVRIAQGQIIVAFQEIVDAVD
jgi:16S rRNA processing protein RimM